MNGIFGKKRNHPECLLDSETVDRSLEERPTEEGFQTPKILPACTSSLVTTPTKRPKKNHTRAFNTTKKCSLHEEKICDGKHSNGQENILRRKTEN